MSCSCSSVQVENTNADFLHLSLKCNLVGVEAREQAGRLQRSELFTARLNRTQPISVLWGERGAVAGGETGSYLLGWEGRQLQPGCCSDGITKGFTRLPIGFGAASHARTRPQALNVPPRTRAMKLLHPGRSRSQANSDFLLCLKMPVGRLLFRQEVFKIDQQDLLFF